MALFAAALCAPTVDAFVRPVEARGPAPERRPAAPAPAPPTNLRELLELPEQLDAHFRDTFGLRDRLLRWNSLVKYFALGVSPTERAYVGREGWLFYTGSHSVELFRGTRPVSAADVAAIADSLAEREALVRARGATYLAVLVPTKETIFPDLVAPALEQVAPTRLERLIDELEGRRWGAYLDLRPALRAGDRALRGDEALYCPHGTHWQHRGTRIAYRAIVERLQAAHAVPAPLADAALDLVPAPHLYDSMARSMYVEDVLAGTPWEYVPREPRARVVQERQGRRQGGVRVSTVDDARLPRALFVHDSFGPYLERLLAEHFSTLVCAWTPRLDAALVESARADVVIELIVERRLGGIAARGATDEE